MLLDTYANVTISSANDGEKQGMDISERTANVTPCPPKILYRAEQVTVFSNFFSSKERASSNAEE